MTAPSAGSTAAAVGRDGADGDRIQLRGIRATGIHGVLPEERVRPQPFEVDLDLWPLLVHKPWQIGKPKGYSACGPIEPIALS